MSADFVLALSLTFAASAHCVGMCGGFVLAVAGTGPGGLRRFADQALLHLGKATSYAFLGALAGSLGGTLAASPILGWTGRVLGIVAGLALALTGLTLLGLRGVTARAPGWALRLWEHTVAPLLRQRPAGSGLIVGMAMGFLPCPLVYAGVAVAAASGSAAKGAAIMAAVALGTLPALALVALLGGTFSPARRTLWARTAGVLVLAAGVWTLTRGLGLRAGHAGHGMPASAGISAPLEHAGHGMPAAAPSADQPASSAPSADPHAQHR